MANSLKELIQQMQMVDGGFFEGTVIRASPLEIRPANITNYTINESMLTIPEHLTDYTVSVDVSGLPVTTTHGSGTASGNCTMVIKASLKQGDKVALFGYNNNKSFVVLGRLK